MHGSKGLSKNMKVLRSSLHTQGMHTRPHWPPLTRFWLLVLSVIRWIPGLGRSAGEEIGYSLQYSWASLVAQLIKNHLQCGRPGFDPGLGRFPEEGKGYPLQYPGLENSMDCIVCGGHKESDTTE